MEETNSYSKHFERELNIMRAQVEEDDELIIEPYVDAIHEVCKSFAKEGHSGGSAPLAADVLAKTIKAVLGFQILSPLMGTDDEWNDITHYPGETIDPKKPKLYQNKRDSGVFKNEDGVCHYNTAIVWCGEDNWDRFTGSVNGIRSSQQIKEFPFMPKTFYVDVLRVPYDENNPDHKLSDSVTTGSGDMIYFIKDESQIEQVFNFYVKRENNLKSKS